MKAPDKIYLNIPKALYEKDQEIVATWDTKEWDDCINPEYIRKEVLTEWLKEKIRDYWADDENTMGIYPYALEEVINKLNSL